MYDGLLFKGDRILIPSSLRKQMLEHAHRAHLGVNYSISRARELMFWPGMTSQIRDKIMNRSVCRSHEVRQAKEPMMLREVPDRPWQKVAVDLFCDNGKNYLITVDYYSDYFEVDPLNLTTAEAVINKLKCQFARHGIPEELITDNGPQFTGAAFQTFANRWEFSHRRTSPYHSQSNGKAEAAVKQAKRMLSKARATHEDPYLMLLEIRNTPAPDIGLSPVQRLYSRRTSTLMPASAELLHPISPSHEQLQTRLRKRMIEQKRYYDRGTRVLPELAVNDEVWIQPIPGVNERWKRGVVTAKIGERSYEISTDGKIIRRNRVQLRRCQKREVEAQPKQTTATGEIATEAAKVTRSGRAYGVFDRIDASGREKGKDVIGICYLKNELSLEGEVNRSFAAIERSC